MSHGEQHKQGGERGTALIVALMVMIIMTLLGIPFLLMGETESRIAENERLSLQAQYAAESGAQSVKRWFDRPMDAANLVNPSLAVIDRSQRKIDADGDPGTAPVQADGTPGKPFYKQSDDAVFDEPYRGTLVDTLLGTEDGPDMSIDAGASSAAGIFLDTLSQKLFADFPSAESGVRARIRRIDVYAPPSVQKGGAWTRHGIATVKVAAQIHQKRPDGSEIVLAERSVKSVLNEVPYTNGVFGPVRVCEDIEWTQYPLGIRWGLALAGNDADLGEHALQTVSLPRVQPPSAEIDLLWAWDNDTLWDEYYTDHVAAEGWAIDDPWFRLAVHDDITMPATAVPAGQQPWPFDWDGVAGVQSWDLTFHSDPLDPVYGGFEANHSNLFQGMSTPSCNSYPPYPYETWKALALQGGPNVHYFVWDSDDKFRKVGDTTAKTFRELTDGKSGFFFFDTRDGLPPRPSDTNLTPAVSLAGGSWGVEGLVYLNALSFHAHDVVGPNVPYQSPGEPFQDADQDGQWDSTEKWINLDLTGGTYAAAKEDKYPDGVNVVRNARGPVVDAPALVRGILYVSGNFDSTGNGNYYGSIVARRGFKELSAVMDAPQIYWDAGLKENWPPDVWGLPRVLIASWETEL